MGKEITKGMLIGELVREHPACVEVLFNHGFHCIGCDLAADETLEQGARAHGYSDSEIDEIVKELADAAKEEGKIWENLPDINADNKGKGLKISPRFEAAGFGKGKGSGKKGKSEPG